MKTTAQQNEDARLRTTAFVDTPSPERSIFERRLSIVTALCHRLPIRLVPESFSVAVVRNYVIDDISDGTSERRQLRTLVALA